MENYVASLSPSKLHAGVPKRMSSLHNFFFPIKHTHCWLVHPSSTFPRLHPLYMYILSLSLYSSVYILWLFRCFCRLLLPFRFFLPLGRLCPSFRVLAYPFPPENFQFVTTRFLPFSLQFSLLSLYSLSFSLWITQSFEPLLFSFPFCSPGKLTT